MAKARNRIPIVEWIASLISVGIVLATVGYLVFDALRPGRMEPALTIAVVQVRESAGSFVLDVEVKNSSRGAAADVHLAGLAPSNDGPEARAQALLDYVPGLSRRRASLVFAFDPGKDVAVHIIGYARP